MAATVAAGTTASLLSKYRPPMPILVLVVPQLKSDGMRWRLEGRATARQCLLERGLLPVLAAPSPSGAPAPLPPASQLQAAAPKLGGGGGGI